VTVITTSYNIYAPYEIMNFKTADIYVKTNSGTATPYYIHKDYQGSYQTITNSSGAIVETLSFDPWGRRRNAVTWSYTGAPTTFLFDRGYTGHGLAQTGSTSINLG